MTVFICNLFQNFDEEIEKKEVRKE